MTAVRPRPSVAVRRAVAPIALALLAGCSSSSGAAGRTPPPSAPPPAALPAPAPAPAGAPEPTPAAPLPVQAHYATTPDGVALPDRAVTPGAVDPAATPAAVCGADRRRQVPPPPQDKQWVYSTYAVRDRASVRIDHLVPVGLGGTSAVANLWPQPLAGGHGDQKDQLERRLHELVCAGRLPLATAQAAMSTDWWGAMRTYLPAAVHP